jgi:hypothetical protein
MTDASHRHESVHLDRRAALEFLHEDQPLPADAGLTEEQIQTFDAVRRFFLQHPDKEAVPLLVNAFGEGSGFGIYQLVEDTLAQHDHEDVFAALDKALGARGVRYWAGQIAVRFRIGGCLPISGRSWQAPTATFARLQSRHSGPSEMTMPGAPLRSACPSSRIPKSVVSSRHFSGSPAAEQMRENGVGSARQPESADPAAPRGPDGLANADQNIRALEGRGGYCDCEVLLNATQ